MKLSDIYNFFVKEGISSDLRNRKQIKKQLSDLKLRFDKLSKFQKKFFDIEQLKNPYSDTRILYGSKSKEVARILVGIDIEVGEVLLAKQLSDNGKSIDLLLSHHPKGIALAGLSEVMDLQVDVLSNIGIPNNIARGIMNKRKEEVARRLHSGNHSRVEDTARLLEIPLMCCHTPADNHVAKYLQDMMDEKRPKTLQKVVDLLLKEPEYQNSSMKKLGPQIMVGKPDDKAGKIFVDMTGGAQGSKEIYPRLSQLGIDTLLCMHIGEQHLNKIKSEYIKVINAGHIASDNLGMNLIIDKLAKICDLEIIECSGFRRFKRYGRYS